MSETLPIASTLEAAEHPLDHSFRDSPLSETPLPETPLSETLTAGPLPPPREPSSLGEAGLTEGILDALVLKHLLQLGSTTGHQVAREICLPRLLVGHALERLRGELLVVIKSSAGISDYYYQLTEAGLARARQHAARSNYVGAAPMPLASYRLAMGHQSLGSLRLSVGQLAKALAELEIEPRLLSRLAQAINDGRAMLLHGSPGNGKTSIAERICAAFDAPLWIPRMVGIGGDMIRLFDPSCHKEVVLPGLDAQRYDRRWVLIRRPCVIVGGELALDHFEARHNPTTGISEAPISMKAGGGALVIDDFGRQRASATEILNRMILPLEKQVDYLNLASGRQIQVPLDMMCVLATNLAPRDLVDEAFRRRIPYKIEVSNPTPEQFTSVWNRLLADQGFATDPGVLEYLLTEVYERGERPLRFCHPRDLVRQIRNACEVDDEPLVVTRDRIDEAVENYFAHL